MRNLFRHVKETKAVKDGILRDIKNLYEHEEEELNYYKLVIFGVAIVLNMKVMVKEIKHYQLKNILIKLGPI